MAQKAINSFFKFKTTSTMEDVGLQDIKTYISEHDVSLYQQINQLEQDFRKDFTSDIKKLTQTDIEYAMTEVINDVARNPDVCEILEKLTDESEELQMNINSDNNINPSISLSDDANCMYCTPYEPVSKASDIEPGDTIRFKRLKGLYYHYATVTNVSAFSDFESKAKVTLVELHKVGVPFTCKVIEHTDDLDFSKGNIEKALYTSKLLSKAEIVIRAKEMAKKEESEKGKFYFTTNLVNNNCEHTCNKIAQDRKISLQSDSSFCKLKSAFSLWLKAMCKFGSFVFKSAGFATIAAPITVIGAIMLLIEEIKRLKHLLQQGIICLICHDEQYIELKVSLVFSILGLVLSLSTGFHPVSVGISGVLGFLLPFLAPFVYSKIMLLSNDITKMVVKNSKVVREGDVITFPYSYWNDQLEGIVTHMKDSKLDETMVKLTVVHFPRPSLTGTYTVEKEEFYFDLKRKKVDVIDFTGVQCLSNDEVVKRALGKCGETRHSHFTYRSSHMSRFCKTGKEKLENLKRKRAEKIDDLSPGDVINFKYCFLPHEAVVIKVEYAEKMICSIVHFHLGQRKVVEEQREFDLSEQNVFIHKYPRHRVYDEVEVVRRARSQIGKNFNMLTNQTGKNYFNMLTTNQSGHLVKLCKFKDMGVNDIV